jgi:hypothetical protein
VLPALLLLLLLLLLDCFFDALLASSSRRAMISRARSSSSRVLLRPRMSAAEGPSGPRMATTGEWLLENDCSCCGDRLDCAKFKGAGAAFLVAMVTLGGLGKLPESRTGVGLVIDRAGGFGGVSSGGGDSMGFTMDTFDGLGFLGLA